MFLTKNQAIQAFRAVDALSKRALPTLGSILKFSRMKTVLTPSVTGAEGEATMAQAAAEKIDDPQTGQDIIKDVASFNKLLLELMEQDSGLVDPEIRITKADLPRLPEWSDDEKKQEKYNAAREDLANLIAGLGPLFDHEDAKTDT
jgi:hypothetical protein